MVELGGVNYFLTCLKAPATRSY